MPKFFVDGSTGDVSFYEDTGTTAELFWDASAEALGLGTTTPAVKLDIDGTDAIRLPVGTDAQRPTGAAGQIRFNSDSDEFEGYDGTAWGALGSAYGDSDVLTLFNAGGSAPVYACRAWVNFNGTGTVAIRESGNVSSITDQGTGLYRVNFSTAMPDANYSAVAAGRVHSVATAASASITTSYVDLNVSDDTGSTQDPTHVFVAIFR